jgi:hypothetical protein
VREKLAAISFAALAASAIQAGEIKVHHWPTAFVSQEVCDIPVLMDLDGPLRVSVVGGPIRLRPLDSRTYEGCSPLLVRSSGNVHLSAQIIPTGAIGGDYSCSLSNPDIDAPLGFAILCAKLENAEFGGLHGPGPSVRAAVVKLSVSAR